MKILNLFAAAVGAAILVVTPISIERSQDKAVSVSLNMANAVIGRPLTPMSVAGVNRRVHRRAYRRCAVGATCY
jgi:hypothetical protein